MLVFYVFPRIEVKNLYYLGTTCNKKNDNVPEDKQIDEKICILSITSL